MPDQIPSILTWYEVELAALVGTKRQLQNLMKNRADKHGAPRDKGWQVHIEGACGEMAVAKWRRHYWSGNLGDLKADDVGRLQVRTAMEHNYRLIVHDDDADDRAFILVTGMAPRFVIRGWIWGRHAKRQEWWADPTKGNRAAYFVPQSALRPMARLSRGYS